MQRIRQSNRSLVQSARRVGFTTPAVAIALLVVMMGLALIIDRIWLETAKLELMAAAESAALGAAGELASDDMLLANSAVELRLNNARETAAWIASQNYVCGTPVTLNIEQDGDVRFGNLVQEGTAVRFDESDTNPNSVVVTALRTRSNNNPIALFIAGASGLPFGDVAVRVEASINNDVVGIRPIAGTPIPALPIAIWENDPSGDRSDTWVASMESGARVDQYTYDSESHSVISGQDGIPEMVIHCLPTGGDPSKVNVHLCDIGTKLNDTETVRQVKSGLAVDDLTDFEGAIYVGQGTTVDFSATPQFDTAHSTEFQNTIGPSPALFFSIPQPSPDGNRR